MILAITSTEDSQAEATLMVTKKWFGSPPKCDFCGEENLDEFTDGKTRYGPWAVMCKDCAPSRGVGLGLGRGQFYKLQDEEYIKVEG